MTLSPRPGPIAAIAVLLLGAVSASAQTPLGTAFTYQGRLADGGRPANGLYDLRFRLYDAPQGGTQVGGTTCADNVSVADGLFTVSLDFGAQFEAHQRFLEIDARADSGLGCPNPAGFVTLGPRQPITGAPHALGPWRLGTGTLTFTGGNVGIGAASPATLLHLFGGTDPTLRVQSDGTDELSGRLSLRQSNLTGADVYYDGTNTVDGVGIELFAQGNSAGVPFFISNRGPTVGFVGVGTSNPQYGLDVAGPGFPLVNLTSPNTVGTWLNLGNTSTGGTNWQLISTGSGNGGGAGNLLLGTGVAPNSSSSVLTLTPAGNVGIGTVTPFANLHVSGLRPIVHLSDTASGAQLRMFPQSIGGRLETSSNHALQLGTNSVARLTIGTGGHVFIHNMNSRNTLQVGWDNNNDELTVDTSTRRHKANITPLTDDFERILDAEPKAYTRPDDPSPDRWEIGYIAEDLHDLGLRRLVFYDEEGLPLAINYSRIPLYLAEVLRGQRKELAELRAENAELRARLDRLEQSVNSARSEGTHVAQAPAIREK